MGFNPEISRRDFLKIFSTAGGGTLLYPLVKWLNSNHEVLASELPSSLIFLPLVLNEKDCNPGRHMLGVEVWRGSVDQALLQKLTESRTQLVRTEFKWDLAESIEGQYDFDYLRSVRQELQQIKELGIKILLTVKGTPAFAQTLSGVVCSPVREEKIDSFQNLLTLILSGSGDFKRLPVDAIELGNEPDIPARGVPYPDYFGCWVLDHDGDGIISEADYYRSGFYYAQVLLESYTTVKKINPNLMVVAGALMLVNRDTQGNFTRGLADGLEGQTAFDLLSFHLYTGHQVGIPPTDPQRDPYWGGNNMQRKADFIRQFFPNIPIENIFPDEIGYACLQETCDSLFEEIKAAEVLRQYIRAITNGLRGYIWYTLKDPEWAQVGLLGPHFEDRPAYHVYKYLSQLFCSPLEHQTSKTINGFEQHVLVNPHTRETYTFVWRNDGQPTIYPVPQGTDSVTDHFGNILPGVIGGSELEIGYYPFVLRDVSTLCKTQSTLLVRSSNSRPK